MCWIHFHEIRWQKSLDYFLETACCDAVPIDNQVATFSLLRAPTHVFALLLLFQLYALTMLFSFQYSKTFTSDATQNFSIHRNANIFICPLLLKHSTFSAHFTFFRLRHYIR
jgi:hypothetical protein